MPVPTEINALKYYELETKARGFDILQELEALNDRISMLKNAKGKVIKDLQNIYKKMEESLENNSEVQSSDVENNNQFEDQKSELSSTQNKKNDDKTRPVKSVHNIGSK